MKLAVAAALMGVLMSSSSVLAADMMPPGPLEWTGFYLGGQAGGALSRPNETGSSELPSSDLEIAGGVNAQALYQMDDFVFGAVIDGNISGPLASQTCTVATTRTCQDGSSENFSARGKLGFAFDNIMIYGTGGWGWADYQKKSFLTADGSAALSDQRTLSGWVAGAGLSYAINDKWISNVEYLHYDLGSSSSYSVPGPETIAPSMDTVTVGIGYKF